MLRYVVAVVDAGSVVAAADLLRTTQPSLSRQIRRLEQDLGFELFVRGSGPLRLSTAGRSFLPRVRDLLDRADATERAARALARGRLHDVAIAATPTTLTDIVAPFLVTLTPDDPWPDLRPEVSDLVHTALERDADLAVGPHPPAPSLAGIEVAEFPVLAHVPTDHPWADKDTVDITTLVGERLLLPRPGAHARRRLDAALTAAGIVAAEVHEFDSSEVALAVAASGRGVAVVSDDPRFGLRSLPVVDRRGPLLFTLFATWDPSHHAAGELADLAGRLATFCRERYPRPQAQPARQTTEGERGRSATVTSLGEQTGLPLEG